MTSKVARSHDQSEPSWPNAVPVSLEAGGDIPCWPNLAATILVNKCIYLERICTEVGLGEPMSTVLDVGWKLCSWEELG